MKLKKVGNSSAILITKEMKRYLGLQDDEIDLDYSAGRIVIGRPVAHDASKVKEAIRKRYDVRVAKEQLQGFPVTEQEIAELRARFPSFGFLSDLSDEDFDALERSIAQLKKETFQKRA